MKLDLTRNDKSVKKKVFFFLCALSFAVLGGCQSFRTYNEESLSAKSTEGQAESAKRKKLIVAADGGVNQVNNDSDESEEDDDKASHQETAAADSLEAATIKSDSAKSPEELSEIVDEFGMDVAGQFPLCEGSVYLEDWKKEFDRNWYVTEGKKFSSARSRTAALKKDRAKEFRRLLTSSFGSFDFDFPVVVTEDVIKWVNYFQTRGRGAFTTWLRRGQDLTDTMKTVLEDYGLPKDLFYLAMIESGFSTKAFSHASATGPWQFMRGTGKIYDLKMDDFVDERRDPVKATHAAARYLSNLYSMFGDWHLAAASYNAGEGRILRAMRGTSKKDFFSLANAKKLPNETRNYVPKIIAAIIISKNPSRFGFDVAEGSRAVKIKELALKKPVHIQDVAKAVQLNVSVLEYLNPELNVGITPIASEKKPYLLKVPSQVYDKALASLATIPDADLVRTVAIRAPKKESVASFATRAGISVKEFLKWNPQKRANSSIKRGEIVVAQLELGSGKYAKIIAATDKKGKSKAKSKKKRRRNYSALR